MDNTELIKTAKSLGEMELTKDILMWLQKLDDIPFTKEDLRYMLVELNK